ncbi:MAG: hypothetical protein IJ638_03200 [Alphaproteobacteria bacterium]|nr:hypothetical protein [Alphaproteobacteria bacterium]
MITVQKDNGFIHSFGGILIIEHKEKSGVGKRIKRSSENVYGWEKDITKANINFENPIVLCLGGAGIDNDKEANGFAKTAQSLLGRTGIINNEVQLLSVTYPKDLQLLGDERKKFSRNEPRKRSDYISHIYETIFSPIIETCFNQSEINKINYDVIKKLLRNITIFSHCHGSFVACELIRYFKEDLLTACDLFESPAPDMDDILGEITNIMLSPRSGVQNCDNALNIGFTFASDNLGGGIDKPIRKGKDISISKFCDNLKKNKFKGCDNFYHKYGSVYNFWDTDRFGADISFKEDFDCDYQLQGPSEMIYKNIFVDTHFHIMENYCSVLGKIEEEGIGRIYKNEKGQNFTKIIAKALQNAVSLSSFGAKRTLKEIISNDTEIGYRQGPDEENPHFKNVKFDGDLNSFEYNYKLKLEMDKAENKPIKNSNKKTR